MKRKSLQYPALVFKKQKGFHPSIKAKFKLIKRNNHFSQPKPPKCSSPQQFFPNSIISKPSNRAKKELNWAKAKEHYLVFLVYSITKHTKDQKFP